MSHAAHTRIPVAGAGGVPDLQAASLAGLEPVFEPAEVSAYLKLDVTTVRRLFLDRPDVVRIGRPSARGGRRSYVTLRIPLSAVRAFMQERMR
jgi:hypothetical protein